MMNPNSRRLPLLLLTILLSLFATLFITHLNTSASENEAEPLYPYAFPPAELIEKPSEEYFYYLPLILDPRNPPIELLDAWTSKSNDAPWLAYNPGEDIKFWIRGSNNTDQPVTIELRWNLPNPCGDDIFHRETLELDPGQWQRSYSTSAPLCSGVFETTIYLLYQNLSPHRSTAFVANGESAVVLSDRQGFDKCGLPEVEKMQTWWDNSPYQVFNLYLGGVSFACKNNPLDAVWVRKVAEQGWKFIQAWVGPQAPCSSYSHRMSDNKTTAYNQGRQEAQDAAEAAFELGFFNNKIIYYDVEAYSDDSSACHQAVQSFLRGWVEELHARGYKAGAYGSSCTSYMTGWADINPPLDDVWIANWYYPPRSYDPQATVWGAACLSNDLWNDHQRIRQYTGGHSETWGEVSITIDSNVLDGEINTLDVNMASTNRAIDSTILERSGTPIQAVALLSPAFGWLLSQGHLFGTKDSGASWQDITPEKTHILDAAFPETQVGWLVGRVDPFGEVAAYRTGDGGLTWESSLLPLTPDELSSINSAYIDPLDAQSAYVMLKLQSGSSFSLGRLFFTGDGGMSWHERSIPIGEAVKFLDAQQGWTAGGPAGDRLYYTQDGGDTWQRQELAIPFNRQLSIGLPSFFDHLNGWLPVGLENPSGSHLVFYRTENGGSTWFYDHASPVDPTYWANGQLLSALATRFDQAASSGVHPLKQVRLPKGTVFADFADLQHGWVVTQEGACHGDKGVPGAAPLFCQQQWRLLATDDGGSTWHEIRLR